jgi:hypothetical protein
MLYFCKSGKNYTKYINKTGHEWFLRTFVKLAASQKHSLHYDRSNNNNFRFRLHRNSN